LSAYFHKYEFKNATLIDFINELDQQFEVKEINLEDWRRLWLETASLNQIEPQWDSENKSSDATMKIRM
jgi:aminopeptidase N